MASVVALSKPFTVFTIVDDDDCREYSILGRVQLGCPSLKQERWNSLGINTRDFLSFFFLHPYPPRKRERESPLRQLSLSISLDIWQSLCDWCPSNLSRTGLGQNRQWTGLQDLPLPPSTIYHLRVSSTSSCLYLCSSMDALVYRRSNVVCSLFAARRSTTI